ncbi:MAG: ATP-binding protein [Litorimonas sp.]
MAEGLAEVYIADLYNEVGDYDLALEFARKAEGADDPLIQRRSWGEAMIAQAGLGNRREALSNMERLGFWKDGEFAERADQSEAALHARALLAASTGDPGEAVALMNRRLDLMIGKMYDRGAADTAAFLTHLENGRERQQERENALAREAELKAVQLEQQTKLNRMLWILLGGLAIAFNCLLAFLRYREKNNRKVHALQEDALSAEKMKTQFLGNINHEMRTPLNGIIGLSDAMIHHASDPALKAQATTIQESGQLLHDLLDSLITMSTIEGGRLSLDTEPIDMARLLSREAAEWEAAAAAKGLTFTAHVDPALSVPVLGDRTHLRKCAHFLLSNAVRFTHSGRVHLHATGETDADGQLTLTLIVADTGQGISDAVQSRLFKPFLQADSSMTRKYGGAGLSLAIARKLARMMGGDLSVTSREGRGSEFAFTACLPLASADADALPAKTAVEATPVQPAETRREPEEVIDLMLGSQLFAARPQAAPSPKTYLLSGQVEGLDRSLDAVPVGDVEALLHRLQESVQSVVLIDLTTSDPVEAVRRIRELEGTAGQVPLIGLSSPETARLGSELIMAGLDAFLTLPATSDQVTRLLASVREARAA